MKFRFFLPLVLLFLTLAVSAQNSKLADQYYLEGEYQKAEKLVNLQSLYELSN